MKQLEDKAAQTPSAKKPTGRLLAVIDSFIWIISLAIAGLLRFGSDFDQIPWGTLTYFAVAAIVLQVALGFAFKIYRKGLRSPIGSFEDGISAAGIIAAVGVILWIASLAVTAKTDFAHALIIIATLIALVASFATRMWFRIRQDHFDRPSPESASPALILGGGYVGTHLIQWMMADRFSPYLPVGVIDDDPDLATRRIRGVPVLGTFADIEKVAAENGVKTLIVAIADADAALLRKVQDTAKRSGLTVKVMPPIGQVVAKGIRGNDLRDLSIEDLLGRQPVETNVSEIASYLKGKRVLVTGAGGSIGSQLCTEIAKYGPKELMMLDRDETGLQQALINVEGNGLLDTDEVILADIREADVIMDIFQKRRPQVVFHAAALKHLPMLEQYPDEGWKTNVLGTLHVLQAAAAVDVEKFVNISTDKAANPTSVLGHSKRVAEKLTAWYGTHTGKPYLSVRFGNVIGSRGSMLPTFTRLIMEDKPLTVTHPDVTRFFMTIPEACQLVLQAGGIGRSGEVLILDMGEPVKILDIAQRMIEMSRKDIDIVFTGLREGEKMHEELVGDGETEERPFHPKISHAHAESLDPDNLDHDEFMKRAKKL